VFDPCAWQFEEFAPGTNTTKSTAQK